MKPARVAYFAAGYVLGARAGRGRYDQLAKAARTLSRSAPARAATGIVRAQAGGAALTAARAVRRTAAGPKHDTRPATLDRPRGTDAAAPTTTGSADASGIIA